MNRLRIVPTSFATQMGKAPPTPQTLLVGEQSS